MDLVFALPGPGRPGGFAITSKLELQLPPILVCNFLHFYYATINRKMRNIIESKLEDRGYSIHDQTQRGLGKSGQKPGELDILIKKESLPVTIIEGMIHRDRKYLTEHIEKAVGRYNPSGCRLVYVLVYTREIDKDWMDTRSWINDFPGLSGNYVDSGFEKNKIFEGLYAESIETRIIAIPIGK